MLTLEQPQSQPQSQTGSQSHSEIESRTQSPIEFRPESRIQPPADARPAPPAISPPAISSSAPFPRGSSAPAPPSVDQPITQPAPISRAGPPSPREGPPSLSPEITAALLDPEADLIDIANNHNLSVSAVLDIFDSPEFQTLLTRIERAQQRRAEAHIRCNMTLAARNLTLILEAALAEELAASPRDTPEAAALRWRRRETTRKLATAILRGLPPSSPLLSTPPSGAPPLRAGRKQPPAPTPTTRSPATPDPDALHHTAPDHTAIRPQPQDPTPGHDPNRRVQAILKSSGTSRPERRHAPGRATTEQTTPAPSDQSRAKPDPGTRAPPNDRRLHTYGSTHL